MAEHRASSGRLDNPDVQHEHSDIPLNGLLAFFGVLIVAAAVIHVVIWFVMLAMEGPGRPQRGEARPFVAEPGAPPPGPQFERLIEAPGVPIQQVNPVQEMRALRLQEQAQLLRWGWQETPAGLRLPVSRALDALASAGIEVQRGAPVVAEKTRAGSPPRHRRTHEP